jgi:S1-C subfamily serine protease
MPRRGLVAIAAVVATALLAGGAALAGGLRSRGEDSAAQPKPSATALPTRPSHPFATPSAPPTTGQNSPFGAAPSSPPNGSQQPNNQQPFNQQPNNQQPGTLTPQQSAVAAKVSKGLVDINTTVGYDGSRGAGTGIVLSSDGLILTNHHVIAGATSISVTDVGNGQTYGATVLGYDSTHDVAVLRLQNASGLTVASLGSSASVKVGQDVVAVGNAGGVGGTPSAVAGTVQALDQAITVQDESTGAAAHLTGLIQFDAAIQPGDSGGGLADSGGNIVGVVTAESVAGGNSDTSTATNGYAVPIDLAHSIAQQIIRGQSSATVHIGATGFLGIQSAAAGSQGSATTGVEVAGVVPGSPAEQAGIQQGDVITAVNGHAVASIDELHTALTSHKPGDTVSITWTDQNGQNHTASVRLGSGPVG